jgi:transposase InsO family protein
MTKFFITVRSISNDQFDDDLGAVRYLAVSDGVAPAGMYRKPCRALIWRMSVDNRLWGHRTFMVNCSSLALRWLSRLSPNTWPRKAPMDLFVVPTIDFIQLYVLVIGRLARRELAWINVTAHPTPEWIAQQVTEAFPWNQVPRYLIRDRDGIYGAAVTRRLRAMGLRDKPIAPGSPWQNGYVERLIGTIRRECLDHTIVFGEAHLRR